MSADSFGVSVSLTLLAFAYLGGITSIGGALVAGSLAPLGIGYVVVDRSIKLGKYYLLISGILLVVTAIANPSGIAGQTRAHLTAANRRLGRQVWARGRTAAPAVPASATRLAAASNSQGA